MNIYHYDKITKEFLNASVAEADPMETKIKGEFVPLVPGCATLIAPPETGANEIAVFNNGKWVITPDFRGQFTIDENLILTEIKDLGPQEGIIVNGQEAELIRTNPGNYKISNGALIEKTEAEIQAEEAEKEKEALIATIKQQLYEIDLKSIRPARAGESDRLLALESQAEELRKELQELQAGETT